MSLRGLIFNRVAYIDENRVNYEDETNWIMKTILDAAIEAAEGQKNNYPYFNGNIWAENIEGIDAAIEAIEALKEAK